MSVSLCLCKHSGLLQDESPKIIHYYRHSFLKGCPDLSRESIKLQKGSSDISVVTFRYKCDVLWAWILESSLQREDVVHLHPVDAALEPKVGVGRVWNHSKQC